MTDEELIELGAGKLLGNKILFNIEWEVFAIPLDFINETNEEFKSGCIANRYKNGELFFATLYILEDEFQNLSNAKQKLEFIKEKSIGGLPVILYDDNKYKTEASKWNDGKCTVLSLDEFKKI